ncbi:MAG: peptidoglycan DD-metalloendopeptidase family protein [Rhodospirillales bacterium]|nr:peptidoglycan DD-metalloendopeptidase family protein [Rhodospirillales bacterium]MCB9996180.1 peptidoglycan DD-metalloendopeptidase family protein [Rhodospirillales bacterium]
MTSCKMRAKAVENGLLRCIARFLPVRERYVLTRDNRLRLRFALPPVLAGGVFALMVLSSSVTVSGSVSTLMGPVAEFSSPMDAAGEKMAVLQKRLQRYSNIDQSSERSGGLQLASFTPPDVPAPAGPKEEVVSIGKGDTLAGALQRAGIGASESYKLVMAMEEHLDPRKIRPGQEIHVRFDPADEGDYRFSQMQIGMDALRTLNLTRQDDGSFAPSVEEKEVVRNVYAGRADIKVSLYGSAAQAGIPMPVIAQAIHVYSWDIDFQRDIRKGDSIEVLYDQLETAEGQKVKSGDVLYARLNVNGQDIPVYRFERDGGDVDYFTADGKSIRKALMQTPIDGARLSSGFGKRKHPVLGYEKMHKGVDFAAPRGTPIYAAGDGTIEKAGPFSSYGNYIRIRHNASLKTAYAHLNGFAKGISSGKRVKQGQIIGYVGTTGRSTGPHLHYEVLQNNRQVNPKNVKLPQGETLRGTDLAAFKKHVEGIEREYATLMGKTKLASRQSDSKSTVR